MSDAVKSRHKNMTKRWLIIAGVFLLAQLIFIIVDGTLLETNLNRIGKWMLDFKMFTDWITPYSYSFFNLCLTIHLIAILGQVLHDIVSAMFLKNKEG